MQRLHYKKCNTKLRELALNGKLSMKRAIEDNLLCGYLSVRAINSMPISEEEKLRAREFSMELEAYKKNGLGKRSRKCQLQFEGAGEENVAPPMPRFG
jgi:hypothetical protein